MNSISPITTAVICALNLFTTLSASALPARAAPKTPARAIEQIIQTLDNQVIAQLTRKHVPGYHLVVKSIDHLDVSEDIKGRLASIFLLDSKNEFYKLKNTEVVRKAKEELAHSLAPNAEIKPDLLAYDVSGRVYLFPEFFEITNPTSQAGILFQLGLQRLKANAYRLTVPIQEAYEKWIKAEYHYSSRLYPLLADFFEDPTIDIRAAVRSDFYSGRLRPYLQLAPMNPIFSSLKSNELINHVYQGRPHPSDNATNELIWALPLETVYPFFAFTNHSLEALRGYYFTMIQRNPQLRIFRALLRNVDHLKIFAARETETSWKTTWVLPWISIPYEGPTSGPHLRPLMTTRGLDSNYIELSLEIAEKEKSKFLFVVDTAKVSSN